MAGAFGTRAGWSVAGAAVVLVGAVVVGGSRLPVRQAEPVSAPVGIVGTTTAICSVGESALAATTVDAVVARRSPGRNGVLVGRGLDAAASSDPSIQVDAQGFGDTLTKLTKPLLLTGDGAMATASAAALSSSADSGVDQGLTMAPCTAPATDQWFVGLGADAGSRSELVLSNPDAAQAEVDLRFYGPDGELVVPGSPGLVVPARGTQTVALGSLLTVSEPVTVEVRATDGRVAAMARDLSSASSVPTGADWHPASTIPARDVVVPAVAGGAGTRRLSVVNPSDRRATVSVQVVGADGSYAPAGAQQLELAPLSTGELSLAGGLAGAAAGIRVTSDEPITAAVRSTSSTTGAAPDIAIAVASAPILRLGVAPVASLPDVQTTLVLSNVGPATVTAKVEVVGLDGVVVSSDDVPVADGASSVRTVRSSRPVYLTVAVPSTAQVYGGVSLATTGSGADQVAGLTGMALISPDVAGRAPSVVPDAAVAR
ncbi:MAG: DUF5719 family protein [Propionibacteriaceae bacterium]